MLSMEDITKLTERRIRQINKAIRVLKAQAPANPSSAKRYAEEEERLFELKKSAYDEFNRRYNDVVGRTK